MVQPAEPLPTSLTWIGPFSRVTAQVALEVSLPLHHVCAVWALELHPGMIICCKTGWLNHWRHHSNNSISRKKPKEAGESNLKKAEKRRKEFLGLHVNVTLGMHWYLQYLIYLQCLRKFRDTHTMEMNLGPLHWSMIPSTFLFLVEYWGLNTLSLNYNPSPF